MIGLEPIPFSLCWESGPEWVLGAAGFTAAAGPQTDLFVDPLGKVDIHKSDGALRQSCPLDSNRQGRLQKVLERFG
jgi:hypothetical protein